MNSPDPVPAAAAATTVLFAKDAPEALAKVKEEIESLGTSVHSIEVHIITEAKTLWSRFELYIIGVGSAVATLFVAHLLKIL